MQWVCTAPPQGRIFRFPKVEQKTSEQENLNEVFKDIKYNVEKMYFPWHLMHIQKRNGGFIPLNTWTLVDDRCEAFRHTRDWRVLRITLNHPSLQSDISHRAETCLNNYKEWWKLYITVSARKNSAESISISFCADMPKVSPSESNFQVTKCDTLDFSGLWLSLQVSTNYNI